eukprot:PhM_4_TR4695/c0_g1_i1/m.28448
MYKDRFKGTYTLAAPLQKQPHEVAGPNTTTTTTTTSAETKAHHRLLTIQIKGNTRARNFVVRVFYRTCLFELKAIVGVRIGVAPKHLHLYADTDVDMHSELFGWLPQTNATVIAMRLGVATLTDNNNNNTGRYTVEAFHKDISTLPSRTVMSEDLSTALKRAVAVGDFDAVRTLGPIDDRLNLTGESIECIDAEGFTPLQLALGFGTNNAAVVRPHVPLAMYLVSRYGADVQHRGHAADPTPLDVMRADVMAYRSVLEFLDYTANMRERREKSTANMLHLVENNV